MSDSNLEQSITQHAMLVAWGDFAQQIGLVTQFARLQLHQKGYQYSPRTKVLEFLVATLAGYEHLKDISHSALPLDQDQSVAQAWGQTNWADYSGVSRTLKALSLLEAQTIVAMLNRVSQPFLSAEVNLALFQEGHLIYDGDLTGLPISKSSRSYPGAAFGHMDDQIRLGYQVALVSLRSPQYQRLWLSGTHHPGNTVSACVAQEMVRAAEARTGLHPLRRTDLLRKRIELITLHEQALRKSQEERVRKVQKAQQALEELESQIQRQQARVRELEAVYRAKERKVRPTSQLEQARQRLSTFLKWKPGREKALSKTKEVALWGQGLLEQEQQNRRELEERLICFEQENAQNAQPIQAILRLDAGFGTYDNLAWYIEMGYEVYTKAPNHKVINSLRSQVPEQAIWEEVGTNAHMVAWAARQVETFVYPLDVGVERFIDDKRIKHSLLLHFGPTRVTQHMKAWFEFYNHRQTIEAGIKESKQVFCLNRLKVRSTPAIYLQENCVLFAANFIRIASAWLRSVPWEAVGSKELVSVASHTCAAVVSDQEGRLLRFSDQSVYAGKVLRLKPFTYQLPLPFFQSYDSCRV